MLKMSLLLFKIYCNSRFRKKKLKSNSVEYTGDATSHKSAFHIAQFSGTPRLLKLSMNPYSLHDFPISSIHRLDTAIFELNLQKGSPS